MVTMDIFDFERETLHNGLEIFYQKSKLNETHVRVFFKAGGARFDPYGKEGCAHLLEHLLGKRTRHFSDQIARDDFILEHCLDWGIFTDWEIIWLKGTAFQKEVDNLFFFIQEILFNSKIKEDLLEKEKMVVISEMDETQKIENWIKVEMETRKALFGNHPFGRIISPAGTIQTINSVTIKDVINHQRKFFVTSNLVIVTHTNLKLKTLKDKVERFIVLPQGKIKYPKPLENFPKPSRNFLIYSQSKIMNAKKSPEMGESVDVYAVVPALYASTATWHIILSCIKEMLLRKLRYEMSLIYYPYTSQIRWRDLSLLTITIENIPTGKGEKVTKIIQETISEFHRSEKIFDLLKRKTLLGLKNYQALPSKIVDKVMIDIAIHDKPKTLLNDIREVKDLTFRQAAMLVTQWLNEERTLIRILEP